MMKNLLGILLCLMLVACLDLDAFLFNKKSLDSYTFPENTISDSLITEVTFSSGGETIHGIYVAADSSLSGNREGLTLLYCHGNKWNIDHYWDRVMLLHELGVNLLIFDYRGYGRSSGDLSEKGLHEDGLAALRFLREEKNVVDDSLLIYGYSLGNVVSIYLTSLDSVNPRALFAEAPFASATALTQSSSLFDIPEGWLTTGLFDNAENIKKIRSPYLHLHGKQDDLVRWRDNGRVVYENAPQPKQLILLDQADHINIPDVLGVDIYLDSLRSFIDRAQGLP